MRPLWKAVVASCLLLIALIAAVEFGANDRSNTEGIPAARQTTAPAPTRPLAPQSQLKRHTKVQNHTHAAQDRHSASKEVVNVSVPTRPYTVARCRKDYRCVRANMFHFARHGKVLEGQSSEVGILLAVLPTVSRRMARGRRLVVVDVGGNDGEDVPMWVGYFFEGLGQAVSNDTTMSGKRVPVGDFVVFEPLVQYKVGLERLAKRILGHYGGKVRMNMVNAGVAEEEGELHVIGAGASASLVKTVPVGVSSQGRVPVVRGEAALRKLGFTPETHYIPFLKIDAEGADPTVLISMGEFIATKSVGLIVIELNRRVVHMPRSYANATGFMNQHGYTGFLFGVCNGLCPTGDNTMVFMELDQEHMHAWESIVNLEMAFFVADRAMVTGLEDVVELTVKQRRKVFGYNAAGKGCNRVHHHVEVCAPRMYAVESPMNRLRHFNKLIRRLPFGNVRGTETGKRVVNGTTTV